MSDWLAWHGRYEDAQSPLSRRLAVVRQLIGEALSTSLSARPQILSLCAGDGRDVLPVLDEWRTRKVIAGRLIELDRRLADQARASAAVSDLAQIEVVCGDAARTDNYVGAVPADLVLACGIFGNISDDDVQRTIEAMPHCCGRGGVVIWTRHRREPDLTLAIRRWFASAGFEERAFESPGENDFAVGMHELIRPPLPLIPGRSLFTFIR